MVKRKEFEDTINKFYAERIADELSDSLRYGPLGVITAAEKKFMEIEREKERMKRETALLNEAGKAKAAAEMGGVKWTEGKPMPLEQFYYEQDMREQSRLLRDARNILADLWNRVSSAGSERAYQIALKEWRQQSDFVRRIEEDMAAKKLRNDGKADPESLRERASQIAKDEDYKRRVGRLADKIKQAEKRAAYTEFMETAYSSISTTFSESSPVGKPVRYPINYGGRNEKMQPNPALLFYFICAKCDAQAEVLACNLSAKDEAFVFVFKHHGRIGELSIGERDIAAQSPASMPRRIMVFEDEAPKKKDDEPVWMLLPKQPPNRPKAPKKSPLNQLSAKRFIELPEEEDGAEDA